MKEKEIIANHTDMWDKVASATLVDGQIDPHEMIQIKNTLQNLPFTAKNKKEMTDSHLNMWRLIASAVHADGQVTSEEESMIEKYIEELHFNKEQEEIIRKEMKSPSPLEDILPKITDPGDKSQSLYFVRLLLWKDDMLTDTEEAFLKKINDFFMQSPEMKKLHSQLTQLKENTSSAEELLYSIKNSQVIQFLKKFQFFFKKK